MNAKLLVSVGDYGEAQEALAGGADIIDLKNPRESSLGASSPWITQEVCRRIGSQVPLSASLGDFPNLPGSAALACLGAVWCGVSYVKIGLFGSRTEEEVLIVLKALKRSVEISGKQTKIIATAYGDFSLLQTIPPYLLPEVASEAGIDGCMIDTFRKDGTDLFVYQSPGEIKFFVQQCKSRGLLVALAGSLSLEHFPLLATIGADIIGVRGAACSRKNRLAGVSRQRVARLKEALVQ